LKITKIKISIAALLSFIIAFSILTIVQYVIWNEHFIDNEDLLFVQTMDVIHKTEFLPNDEKIILIGSSHVKQLNSTYIDEIIEKEFPSTSVFNLARGGDSPKERLRILDNILEIEPKIIVYGLGFRDFQSITRVEESAISKPETFLPDPQQYFESTIIYLEKSTNQDFDFLQSAQLTTLRAVREILSDEQKITDAPIQKNSKIMTIDELENPRWISQANSKIQPLHMNKQFLALEEFVKILEKEKIGLIIFTTPHASIYLDKIPEQNKKFFQDILKNISKKYDIPVYYLHDKYPQLDIWSDPTHIAFNTDSLIYSHDVSELILEELKK